MRSFIILLLFILNLSATERIVSLSPSITEILFVLGVGKEIIATSSYSLYPKKAQSLPIIGGYQNPNIEKILSFSPSLVVGQSYNQRTLKNLKKFHIKTVKLTLRTLQNIQDSITKIAQTLHKEAKAKKLNADITNAITNANKTNKPHSVMIVYGLREDLRSGTYIAGHNIFFDDIITACGNTNAYTDKTTAQPVLSYENIIALNPDQIIILHSHATEANVDVKKALKNWYSLPTNAAKNRKISIVDENYIHIPSQRVALTIKRLSQEMAR